MLKTDEHGFIGQHDIYDTTGTYLDFGDCSRTMGLMAIFSDQKEKYKELCNKLHLGNGFLVRHPHQAPWNNPDNFSRDQLQCIIPALDKEVAKKVYEERLKTGYWFFCNCQNNDILLADTMYALAKKAGIKWTAKQIFWAYVIHFLQLIWHCGIKPDAETNQIIAMSTMFNSQRVLYEMHPDLIKNIHDYWSNWRDQHEIAYFIILYI